MLLVGSVIAALLALVAQVAVPAVTRSAIDDALTDRTDALEPFVWVLVGLAVARGLLSFVYRYGLYRMAYEIEYDLRSILYRHLTRLSFSFFDRVQSGQIISRANSDIRSVQMFLAFAPLMATSMLTFAVAFGFMLTIHVGLTLVALCTLPGVYVVGVRLRNRVFPLSWDHPGPPGRRWPRSSTSRPTAWRWWKSFAREGECRYGCSPAPASG